MHSPFSGAFGAVLWASALAVTLAVAPRAQDAEAPTSIAALIHAEPDLLVQFDGPARAWQRLLPTDLGRFLETEDGVAFRALLEQPLHQIGAMVGTGEGKGPRKQLEALLAAVRAYRGRVTLSADFDFARAQRFDARIYLTQDGSLDMALVADSVRDLAAAFGCAREVVEIEGAAFEVFSTADALQFSLPFAVGAEASQDAGLACFVGDDVQSRIAEWIVGGRAISPRAAQNGGAPPPATDPELASALMAVRIALPPVVAELEREVTGHGWVGAKDPMLEVLGFESLRDFRVTVRPRGPRVELETSLAFGEGERGLFGGLFCSEVCGPGLYSLVPDDTKTWQTVRVRWDKVVGAALDAFEPTFQFRTSSRASLGMHIDRDMLAYLDSENLVLADPDGTFDTTTLVVRVLDADKFDAGWAKVTADEPDFATPHSTVKGHEVFATARRFFPTAWSRPGDKLVWAIGDDAPTRVAATVTKITAVQKSGAEPVLPEALERVQRHLPQGLNGIGRAEVQPFSLVILDLLADVIPDPAANAIRVPLSRLLDGMREQGVSVSTVATGYADNRWRLRVLW